jgi:hypothetical protein
MFRMRQLKSIRRMSFKIRCNFATTSSSVNDCVGQGLRAEMCDMAMTVAVPRPQPFFFKARTTAFPERT